MEMKGNLIFKGCWTAYFPDFLAADNNMAPQVEDRHSGDRRDSLAAGRQGFRVGNHLPVHLVAHHHHLHLHNRKPCNPSSSAFMQSIQEQFDVVFSSSRISGYDGMPFGFSQSL
ncbi:hypothetical protein J2Z82_001554 [Virgibacillus litoralis]|uniref:Uncharacterized protein n=1 Tax=Virgibacillus litoralis TaxID=578221 RepID=A0ABS4HCP4_9BACI|nr:hypothetical protein [Virgibacillus litoralis]